MKPQEIVKIRKRMKLTREQFAQRIGVTAGSIQNWEKGVHKPSRVWVERIEQLTAKEVQA